jgi:hypothetical protein
MGHQRAIWRGGEDRQLWLSILVAAMEEVALSDARATPCEPATLENLRAQLAQPVSHYGSASAFSLRH